MDVERATETIAAEQPRRLRLDELLAELGAVAHERPDGPNEQRFTLGDLVDKAAEAGFGFLIGILVLIAIPFFGLSTPFGLAIAIMGLQMLLGRTKPWLPRRARRRELSMAMLDRVARILARRTRWLAKATRRRWETLVRPRIVGGGITLLALGLALPLPIPGSNWVFLIPLFVYAIGILERDGAWIAVGHVLTLIDIALLIALWQAVWLVLQELWGWIT